eukprot:806253-Rhodomonas_salina.1
MMLHGHGSVELQVPSPYQTPLCTYPTEVPSVELPFQLPPFTTGLSAHRTPCSDRAHGVLLLRVHTGGSGSTRDAAAVHAVALRPRRPRT